MCVCCFTLSLPGTIVQHWSPSKSLSKYITFFCFYFVLTIQENESICYFSDISNPKESFSFNLLISKNLMANKLLYSKCVHYFLSSLKSNTSIHIQAKTVHTVRNSVCFLIQLLVRWIGDGMTSHSRTLTISILYKIHECKRE